MAKQTAEPRPTEKCPDCGHKVYVLDTYPDPEDDKAWHDLAWSHVAGCRLIQTRGGSAAARARVRQE
jgi:hypothetical protein